jgi:carbon-monoxide dehydrogenase large subunit
MLEALVDRAARTLGVDSVELRRRNLIRAFPYRNPQGLVYDSGDYARCLDLALSLADATDAGPVDGRGVALYVERAGGAFEAAEIALEPGGRFAVASSARPHGQGHDTTFAQIAADRLHVDPGQIGLHFGDSAAIPEGVGTFGSRSVAMAGSAVALAAEELVARARTLAGETPGAGDRVMDWDRMAALARERGEPLRAGARFESANVFSSGAYVADVRIDRATGELTVVRLVAVDDAGILINPLLAHGQVIGGAVQALGECLVEEVVYDEEGQLRTGSFLDYSLLTSAEIPPVVCGEVQTPSPLNPLGAKGAGEGGAVGALPAVANAVADALAGRHLDPPYTAEKLWRALREVPARA